MRYLFALLLLTLLPTLAFANDVRYQSLTTGNNAWDSGQHVGVAAPTYLEFYNPGTVVVQVTFTQADATANEPAFQLTQGQRRLINCTTICSPKVWFKGVGAAGTVQVTAANSRIGVLSSDLVSPDAVAAALGDATRVVGRSFTVGFADFTEADTSEIEVDPEGALPASAVLIGFRLNVTTPITGGDISAVAIDCGFNGASMGDVLTDGVDGLTEALIDYGSGANAKPNAARAIGGLIMQCTFASTDDDITDAAAGSVTATVYYSIPGPG